MGSNVRDSAAYAMWALARSQSGGALEPYSLSMARRLVCVSLYDREIHVRRAASAAFQENVGRLVSFSLNNFCTKNMHLIVFLELLPSWNRHHT